MTWLWALNFFVLQWLFIRLARVVNASGKTIRFCIIGPVVPLTGWWSNYVWLRRKRRSNAVH